MAELGIALMTWVPASLFLDVKRELEVVRMRLSGFMIARILALYAMTLKISYSYWQLITPTAGLQLIFIALDLHCDVKR